jgi:outer membrane biosynthesis protein TonB
MRKLILALAVVAFVSFSLSAQVSSSEKKAPAKSVEQQSVEKKKSAEQQKLEKQKLEKKRAANEQAQNSQANNPNAPIATFDKLVHDYGTIEQYADGNCEFKFTNTGKEPLILSNVRSS